MRAQVNPGRCTGCGICVSICPVEAIELIKGRAVVSDECIVCGQCLAQCPEGAISLDLSPFKGGKNAYV